MPERIRQCPPASYATVLPPAFPPPDPECSSGSIGLPDPHPPSDDRDWGEAHRANAFLRRSLIPPFSDPAFPSVFPTSSASTSFVSRCTGPRDFVGFDCCSLFFPELLCFFKVDLLSRFDCTLMSESLRILNRRSVPR